MQRILATLLTACAAMLMVAADARAQQPPAPVSSVPAAPAPYGAPITLEQAGKVGAAAVAEARKFNFGEAIAIVEPNGQLVWFQKMDNTQYGAIDVALDKARSAAKFRRSTSAFFDALKAGNTYLLTLTGANAVPGGLPIVVDGKIVGAIGTSGGTGDQDVQISAAGVNALK